MNEEEWAVRRGVVVLLNRFGEQRDMFEMLYHDIMDERTYGIGREGKG